MTDQINKFGGFKLPKGFKFDGRSAIAVPSEGSYFITCFEVNRETFHDITYKSHTFYERIPVIILGPQPKFERSYSICIIPMGLFAIHNYYLKLDEDLGYSMNDWIRHNE